MDDIREVYPPREWDDEGEERRYFGDYQPMLESFGYPILAQVDESDYQGDSFLLFQDGTRYGILVFGWGSCSGCDALQACNSYEDVDALRTDLSERIQWFSSAQATYDYLTTHDWEGDYSWHQEAQQEFLEKAKPVMIEKGALEKAVEA